MSEEISNAGFGFEVSPLLIRSPNSVVVYDAVRAFADKVTNEDDEFVRSEVQLVQESFERRATAVDVADNIDLRPCIAVDSLM